MKKFLIATALMFAAVPAQAQVSEQVCVSLGNFASKVVEARRLGMSKQEVINTIKADDNSIYSLMVTIVNLAYNMPASTPSYVVDGIVTAKCLETIHNDRYSDSL